MRIVKKLYTAEIGETEVRLFRNDKLFLTLPAGIRIGEQDFPLTLEAESDNTAAFRLGTAVMIFAFDGDAVRVEAAYTPSEELAVTEARLFSREGCGLSLIGFDRAFTPQPRNNTYINCDYFHHLPDLSLNGYHYPPILNFSIGSKEGWASFGLLDIPDTKQCRMEDSGAILVESCGGHKRIAAGSVYRIPRILITFPQDEFDGIALFRKKLIELGLYTPTRPDFTELPDWWKYPQCCTYGDQLIETRVGQKIDTEWVRAFVERSEKEYGIEHMVLCIDDSWQPPHAIGPDVDTTRFPDLRGFIDEMHARGHKVMLWYTPMFEKIDNGFETRAQKLGVLTNYKMPGLYFDYFPNCYATDYTHDNAEQFLRETARILFGDGEGELNADAVKLDFLGSIRDPALSKEPYAHPERGLGMREMYHYYEMFHRLAHEVKPDVMINATTSEPRFEHLIDVSRLHDTHSSEMEKETRAHIMTLACPDLPVDTDGALMFPDWLRRNQISTAVCGIPSNYYTLAYGRKDYLIPDDEKRRLGTLMKMTALRPAGTPVYLEDGKWQLIDKNGRINAETFRGETVVYYPTEEGGLGYIFSFLNETMTLPLHGRHFSELTPTPDHEFCLVDYARDRVTLWVKRGVVYTFRDKDDGNSIDRVFSGSVASHVEEDVNYVNE